jgi:hypothetical protein
MPTIIPMLSLTPSKACMYTSYIDFTKSKPTERPQSNKHDGFISVSGANRLRLAVDWLCFLAKDKQGFNPKNKQKFNFKVAFITLTLPSVQIHSDEEIKEKCLSNFLQWLRDAHKVEHYVWRAEKQSNGNIHFHIVVNAFIPHKSIRLIWNKQIDKLGYVKKYTEKMKSIYDNSEQIGRSLSGAKQNIFFDRLRKAKKDNFCNPNSTDIHSLYNVRNIGAYISKYISKTIQQPQQDSSEAVKEAYAKQKVSGRIWFISEKLSKFKKVTMPICSRVSRELEKMIKTFSDRYKEFDYVAILRASFLDFANLDCFEILENIRNYLFKNSIKLEVIEV